MKTLRILALITLVCVLAAPGYGQQPAPAKEPILYSTFHYIDNGGLRDQQTGRFLEAFSLLIPKGWNFDGGIEWVLRTKSVNDVDRGDLTSPAKVMFTIAPPNYRCALVSYPEEKFVDVSRSPAAQYGAFPTGSRYMGYYVCPPMDPFQYVSDVVMPMMRAKIGNAQMENVQLMGKKECPEISSLFAREAGVFNSSMGGAATLRCVTGAMTYQYMMYGMPYREDFLASMMYIDTGATLIWWPRMCLSMRAPAGEFDYWARPLVTSLMSLQFNTKWLVEYFKMTDEAFRKIQDVDNYCRKIDDEICRNRSETMLQIHRDMYPVLSPYAEKRGPDGKPQLLPTDQKHHQNQNGDIWEGDQPPPNDGNTWTPMKENTTY